MTERNALAKKVPNVVLIFHTLRTFCHEISSNKMGVNAAQRITILEISILMRIGMKSESNGWKV